MNITIVGGGYTGLVAAYRLSQQNHSVTILEKNAEVGGLASGFELAGTHLEKAYHHLFKTDTDILDLVKELGIEENLEWRDSSVSIYYNKELHAFNGAFDLIKFKPLSFINRIRAGLVVLYLQKEKNWKKFEKVSAYHWMKKWSGEQVTRVIWEPLLVGKFDTYFDKVSMAWLWARLHIRANSREGLEKEKLGYFNGGFDVITQALLKKLQEKQVNIHVNANIKKIYTKDNQPAVDVVLSEKEETLVSDRILATVPTHVFSQLAGESLDEEYKKKLSRIPYLGAVCAIFTSTQDLSPFYWHNINDLNSPFLVFIHHTRLIPKERYGDKYVYYIGTYIPHEHQYFSDSQEVIYEKWFTYLKNVFPSFDEKQVDQKFLYKFKYAQHIVESDYSEHIPTYKTPINHVYLFNFSQIYPEDRGTNYAVREGNKAAEVVTTK